MLRVIGQQTCARASIAFGVTVGLGFTSSRGLTGLRGSVMLFFLEVLLAAIFGGGGGR